MVVTLEEILNRISPKRRKEIEARSRELIEEHKRYKVRKTKQKGKRPQ